MAITYASNTITVTSGKDTGTATSGGASTLTDTGKSWTTNAYADRFVWIHTGTGAGQIRVIASNTATVLTVDFAWDTQPDNTSQYVVGYNIADIQAADTAGGWGVTTTQGIQTRIAADITTGDGSTKTFLGDVKKALTVDMPAALGTPTRCFQVMVGAVQRFGTVDANDNPHSGCTVKIDGSSLTGATTIFGNSAVNTSGDIYYYDCFITILAKTGAWLFLSTNAITRFQRCTWSRHTGGRHYNADTKFYYNYFHDGINQAFSFGTTFTYPVIGAVFAREEKAIKMLRDFSGVLKQGVFQNNTYDLFIDATGGGAHCSAVLDLIDSTNLTTDKILVNAGPTYNFTGAVNEKKSFNLNIKDASNNPIQSVQVRLSNNVPAEVFNVATDASGDIAEQEVLFSKWTGNSKDNTLYNPFVMKVRKYGYVFQNLTKTIQDAAVAEGMALATNTYIVADVATALAYTGISVNWGTKAITVSGTRTIQELYDYLQAQAATSGNIQYDEPLTTVDGVNLTLTSGWSITVTGSLSSSTQAISGTVTVSTAGFYKDINGIKWIASGDTYYASEVTYTFKDGGTPKAGVWCAVYDAGGTNRLYNTSLTLTEIESNGSGVVNGYLVYKINSTTYTGHTITARQYGYQRVANPENPSGTAITKDVLLTADTFITEATEATVAAYTGISLNYTTKQITVTYVGTRTLDQLYDYIRYSNALQANIDEVDTISTADGTNYLLTTDWDLVITGNGTPLAIKVSQPLKSIAYQGTGALSITDDGFFEDLTHAEWETAGTMYKASHFFTNVKDADTSANIQNAVVAYVNSTGVDVTYSTALANLGVVTDASGNAEGYAVYAIGGTTDNAIQQFVGEYNYGWAVIPKTVSGTSIGTSASYETVRLSEDTFVTLTKANALLVSGITVNHTTWVCDMNLNNLSQTYDNLKARQTRTNDIEAGKAGYMSYYDVSTYSDTGLILRDDGSVYWGAYKWTFSNSGGGGTLKERDAVGVATTQVSIDINNLMYCAFTGVDIAFTAATKTISSTTTDLRNFYDGQTIVITGSASNNGTYTVSGSPMENSLVVVEALVDEAAGASVTIDGGVGSRVQILNTTGRDESDWVATTAYTTGNGVREIAKSITSITRSGTTATVTMVGHGFSTGWHVLISGAVETEYNGLKDITVTGADTFTFGVGGSPASPATGTILAQNEQFWYECVTPGTTGGSEPTWNNVAGNTTTDGTVVWKTRAIELLNTEATTTSAGVAYEHKGTNRSIRVRVMYVCGTKAKKWHTFTGTVTTSGFSQDAAQEDNTVYNNNNINGSLVTECAVIENQIRIYVDDPDNSTTAQRIYNWFQYWLNTDEGIYDQDNYITAADQTHYTLESSQKIVNLDTVNPLEITGANIVPASGTATAIYDVSNGASIILNFNRVEAFVYSTGSGLSATQDQRLTDILADTADMQPKIGTPAGASVSADIAAVKVDTGKALTTGKFIALQ